MQGFKAVRHMVFAVAIIAISSTGLAATITVDGKGMASAVADRAAFSINVSTLDESVSRAESEAATAVKKVLRVIATLPHDEDKLNSSSINIRPEYRWNRAQEKQVFIGYRVDRVVSFELTEILDLGDTIQRLSETEVATMPSPVLKSSARAEAEDLALSKAVGAAKRRAEVIAAAAGQKVVGLESIESTQFSQQAPPSALLRAESAMDTNAASYQPGKLSFSANVVAVFTAEPI
ncbi:MAG: SIMPL domain-containing protein [Luminiphilus sp.]|nr:SIMPL domain-containing protein [Luminiphilus sp.]